MTEERYSPDFRSVDTRLAEIEQRLDNLNYELARFIERHSEPAKPRNGMQAFADGTIWDPGSGRGLYVYNGNTSAWVQWLALP